jgi:methylmalonyl-CoA mutase
LLDRVHLDYISLQLSGNAVSTGPAAVLSALGDLAKEQQIPLENLQGSLYYDPGSEFGPIKDWRYVGDLLQYAEQTFPAYRCLSVDGRSDHAGAAAVVEELAALLRRGSHYLETLTARGLNVNLVAGQLQFCLYVGKSYFVEIAKLRALKILWLNVLKAWNAEPVYPVLDVRFSPEAYTDALYTNMICATSMAMSAVVGGADRLTVLPYDSGRETQAQYPQDFARRIARNVQHLLKLESGFSALADPAGGSFYIEKLTNQLAAAAWEKLDL